MRTGLSTFCPCLTPKMRLTGPGWPQLCQPCDLWKSLHLSESVFRPVNWVSHNLSYGVHLRTKYHTMSNDIKDVSLLCRLVTPTVSYTWGSIWGGPSAHLEGWGVVSVAHLVSLVRHFPSHYHAGCEVHDFLIMQHPEMTDVPTLVWYGGNMKFLAPEDR